MYEFIPGMNLAHCEARGVQCLQRVIHVLGVGFCRAG